MATTSRPAGGSERRAIVGRALHVTLAASAGFYVCRYAFDQPEPAIYALFGAVAMGALSQIPGSGRQRATVIAGALPIALALVAVGTALAVHTATAVAGMAVVGFCLAFSAVAGPRPAGAAPGLQLMYILPSFPPYAPDHLPGRLLGTAIGILLLAALELWVLPARGADRRYRLVLADAIGTASRAADALAARAGGGTADGQDSGQGGGTSDGTGDRHDGDFPEDLLRDLLKAGEALRPALLPPAERPGGAGRTDRALTQAAGAARELLSQLRGLAAQETALHDPESAVLLARVAQACRDTEDALRGGPAPPATRMDEAIRAFQEARLAAARRPAPTRPSPAVLRHQAAVLASSVPAQIAKSSVRVAIDGRAAGPLHPESVFWYASRGTAYLYWVRVRGHLTPHSVHFQNAVRITAGLALARLTAGLLDLAHGFWVLLAVLTLTRTNVIGTWRNVRLALVGTFVGSLAAAGLLTAFGPHTDAYAAVLAPAMLLAFTVGPMLGIAWAQGLLTVVVASAFAQLAPTNWELAQARILDVATGCLIGLVCGVLAWPRGARTEVLRTAAELLRSLGRTVEQATYAMLHDPDVGLPTAPQVVRRGPSATATVSQSIDETGHALRLTQSSFAQLQAEPEAPRPHLTSDPDPHLPDLQAVLVTAHHTLLSAQELLDSHRQSPRPSAPDAIRSASARGTELARECTALADDLAQGSVAPGPPPKPAHVIPSALLDGDDESDSAALPLLIDLETWLNAVARDLAHIRPAPSTPTASD
ncbi:FUSC family protein [Streptomycetaceae bacterium NBC_01309]